MLAQIHEELSDRDATTSSIELSLIIEAGMQPWMHFSQASLPRRQPRMQWKHSRLMVAACSSSSVGSRPRVSFCAARRAEGGDARAQGCVRGRAEHLRRADAVGAEREEGECEEGEEAGRRQRHGMLDHAREPCAGCAPRRP